MLNCQKIVLKYLLMGWLFRRYLHVWKRGAVATSSLGFQMLLDL